MILFLSRVSYFKIAQLWKTLMPRKELFQSFLPIDNHPKYGPLWSLLGILRQRGRLWRRDHSLSTVITMIYWLIVAIDIKQKLKHLISIAYCETKCPEADVKVSPEQPHALSYLLFCWELLSNTALLGFICLLPGYLKSPASMTFISLPFCGPLWLQSVEQMSLGLGFIVDAGLNMLRFSTAL